MTRPPAAEGQSELLDLLALLDDPHPDLERALELLQRADPGPGRSPEEARALAPARRAELARELEQTLRLNALATDRVRELARSLAERLQHARFLRSDDRSGPAAAAGETCDVAG